MSNISVVGAPPLTTRLDDIEMQNSTPTEPLSTPQSGCVELPRPSLQEIIDHASNLEKLMRVDTPFDLDSSLTSIKAIIHHANLIDQLELTRYEKSFLSGSEGDGTSKGTVRRARSTRSVIDWMYTVVIVLLTVALIFLAAFQPKGPLVAPCRPPDAEWAAKCWPNDHTLELTNRVHLGLAAQWDAFLAKLSPEDVARITSSRHLRAT